MAHLLKKVYSKYLIVTNTLTCGCLLGTGDVIAQNIEQRFIQKNNNGKRGIQIDWRRTGRLFCLGLLLGPPTHLWYNIIIDRMIKGTGNKMVFKKILADQLVAGPLFCSSFFFVAGYLEGRGFKGAIEEVKENFIPVYILDWCFWPPAQYVNFRFVPLHYRVSFVCVLTLCWDSVLSFMKHRHQLEDNDEYPSLAAQKTVPKNLDVQKQL